MRSHRFAFVYAIGLGGLLLGCNERAETSRVERAPDTDARIDRSADTDRDTVGAVGTDRNEGGTTDTLGGGGAGASGTTGDMAGRTDRMEGEQVSDGWLTFKVASALYADTRVEGNDLDVDTKNGVVTIKGMVNSPAGKDAAAQLARNIDGVKSVDNQLTVVAEQRQDTVQERDDQIKDRIDKMLDNRFKNNDVDLEVTAGKVTVKGDVENAAQAYQVINAVREAAGVRSVDNQLTLKNNK